MPLNFITTPKKVMAVISNSWVCAECGKVLAQSWQNKQERFTHPENKHCSASGLSMTPPVQYAEIFELDGQ